MKKEKIDSPYTPISRKDRLVTVRLYQRTAEDDKTAIAVCVFKRPQPDIAKVAAASRVETEYVKIGPAGFNVHNDDTGCLFFHVDTWRGGHFRALMKLGIRHITVTDMSPEHGSEASKRAGISVQSMTVTAGGFQLPYSRISTMTEWFCTMGSERFSPDPKVFHIESPYSWGQLPVVWCGLTYDAIVQEQKDANAAIAERCARREAV